MSRRRVALALLVGLAALAVAGVAVPAGAAHGEDVTAHNDSYATPAEESITVDAPGVLANDTQTGGPDGNLTVNGTVEEPGNGSLTLHANGSFTYAPDPGFAGVDTFTYEVRNGTGATDRATVTVAVRPEPADVDSAVEAGGTVELVTRESAHVEPDTLEIALDGTEIYDAANGTTAGPIDDVNVTPGTGTDARRHTVELLNGSEAVDVDPVRNLTVAFELKRTVEGVNHTTTVTETVDLTGAVVAESDGHNAAGSSQRIYRGTPIAIVADRSGNDTDVFVNATGLDATTGQHSRVLTRDTASSIFPDGQPVAVEFAENGSNVEYFEVHDLNWSVAAADGVVTAGENLTVELSANRGGTPFTATVTNAAGETVATRQRDLDGTGETTLDFDPDRIDGLNVDDGPYTVTATDNRTATVASTGELLVTNTNLAVDVVATTSPVTAGEVLSVTARVENVGTNRDTQTVALEDFEGTQVDAEPVTLDPGESTTVTLGWATAAGDGATGEVTVDATTDAESTGVTVERVPADFATDVQWVTSPVVAGTIVTARTTVTNLGGRAGTQPVTLATPNGTIEANRSVTLDAGQSTTIAQTWSTDGSDAVSGQLSVASANETATAPVTVRDALDDPHVTSAVEADGTVELVTANETAIEPDSLQVFLNGSEIYDAANDTAAAPIDDVSVSPGPGTDAYRHAIDLLDGGDSPVDVDPTSNLTVAYELNRSDGTTTRVAETVVVTGAVVTETRGDDTVEDASRSYGRAPIAIEANASGNDTGLFLEVEGRAILDVRTGEHSQVHPLLDSADWIDAGETLRVEFDDPSNVEHLTIQDLGWSVAAANATVGAGENVTVGISAIRGGAPFTAELRNADGDVVTTVQPTLAGGGGTTVAFDPDRIGGLNADDGPYTVVATDVRTATTAATDEIAVVEDADPNLSVNVASTTAPVTEGEPLQVAVDVANVGTTNASQTITLTDVDGTVVDAASVALAAGATTRLSLAWPTGDGDAGSGPIAISSANDTATATVAVEALGGGGGGSGGGGGGVPIGSPGPGADGPTVTIDDGGEGTHVAIADPDAGTPTAVVREDGTPLTATDAVGIGALAVTADADVEVRLRSATDVGTLADDVPTLNASVEDVTPLGYLSLRAVDGDPTPTDVTTGVSAAALADRDAASLDVVLYGYHDGAWRSLDRELTGEALATYRYGTTVRNASVLAVGVETDGGEGTDSGGADSGDGQPADGTAGDDGTSDDGDDGTSGDGDDAGTDDAPGDGDSGDSDDGSPGFGALLAAGAILVAVGLLRRRR